jgi:threonine synthase
LVPQTFYYLEAMRQGGWSDCVFAVPSGNLGNLTAGLLAALAGLPVRRFIAALNANDTFLRHLETGTPGTRPVRRTFSSAMDVSLPNNLERLISLTGGDRQRLRRWVWSASFSDDTTLECMARVRAERGYLLDPHGAVGMLGAEAYRREEGNEGPMVVLATAHPAKLTQVVEKAVGERPSAPPEIVAALAREEKIVPLYPSEERFFELLEEVGTARVMAR